MTNRIITTPSNRFDSGGRDLVSSIPPIGSIVAWIGGSFVNASNGSYVIRVGSANTVAAVNTLVGPNWKVCDGTAVTELESPIFYDGRRLPNLTDDRFTKGDTTAGAIGGGTATFTGSNIATSNFFTNSSVSWAHTHTGPSHNHNNKHYHIWGRSIQNHARTEGIQLALSSGNTNETTISWTDAHELLIIDSTGGGSGVQRYAPTTVGIQNSMLFTTGALASGGEEGDAALTGLGGTGNTGAMSANSTKNPSNSFCNTGDGEASTVGETQVVNGNYRPAGTVSNVVPVFLSVFYLIRIK